MVKRSKENRAGPPGRPQVSASISASLSGEGGAESGARERLCAREGPLDGAVREAFALSWGKARDWVRTGKVSVEGHVVTDPLTRVRVGDALRLNLAARKVVKGGGGGLPESEVVFWDAHVIVVRKPPGLSTVPYDGTETSTLDEQVRTFLGRATKARSGAAPLGVVHRIDKETSGLVVFTRSWLAKQSLGAQFRDHTVHRRYLAIAHGVVRKATYRSHLIENRGDGLRGSFKGPHVPPSARLAITHVEPLEALEGATFVACKLETGRTHQIRIHLSEAGHPIVGERVYNRQARKAGAPEIPAPRLMLHAAELGFVHPKTGQEMRFDEPVPADFARVLAMLRP